MLGYDWIRLHALNDLPVALLLAAVLFDLIGTVNKRESLKAAGFWCLIAGVLGGGVAILSGLMAEGQAPHDEIAHEIMETHQTMALVTFVLFSILALWRIARRGILGKREQAVFTTAGVIGVGLLVFTARLGGSLVFDRATGIDNRVLQQQIESRRGGHQHVDGVESVHADSAAHDSTDHHD